MTVTTIAEGLAEGRRLGLERLDAQLLLAHVLERPRTWVLAHDDARLSVGEVAAWNALARRRAAGEPLAYLVGQKEFHGLTLAVGPAVLVPRPETELLVQCGIEALQRVIPAAPSPPRLVDLGTGSGAVALAIKSECPSAIVHASDESERALEQARVNARRLAVHVDFRQGSWWEPWADARFHVALSNPPYIAPEDPLLAALRFEPRQALASADGGLSALRLIVKDAARHLEPEGWLWLEHGHEQDEAVRTLLEGAGFIQIETRQDLAARPRCSGGRRSRD